MIRVLIVDDELPARERLRQLLSSFKELQIVDEAGNGMQAIEKIDRVQPDLVLLDIQMPAAAGSTWQHRYPRPVRNSYSAPPLSNMRWTPLSFRQWTTSSNRSLVLA